MLTQDGELVVIVADNPGQRLSVGRKYRVRAHGFSKRLRPMRVIGMEDGGVVVRFLDTGDVLTLTRWRFDWERPGGVAGVL